MRMLADVLVGLVALLHLYFLVLEMFLWTKPLGLKVFRNTPEKAEVSKVLAANQGLYNGFLVAGLVWGLYLRRRRPRHQAVLPRLRDRGRGVRRLQREQANPVGAGSSRRRRIGAGVGVLKVNPKGAQP